MKYLDERGVALHDADTDTVNVNGVKHADGTYTWESHNVRFENRSARLIDGYESSNDVTSLDEITTDTSSLIVQIYTYHKADVSRTISVNVRNSNNEIIMTKRNIVIPLNQDVSLELVSNDLPDRYLFDTPPIVRLNSSDDSTEIDIHATSVNELATSQQANITLHFINENNVEYLSQVNVSAMIRAYDDPYSKRKVALDDYALTVKQLNDLKVTDRLFNGADDQTVINVKSTDFDNNLKADVVIDVPRMTHAVEDTSTKPTEDTSTKPTEDTSTKPTEDEYQSVSKAVTRRIKFVDNKDNRPVKDDVVQTVSLAGTKNVTTGEETYESSKFESVPVDLANLATSDKVTSMTVDGSTNDTEQVVRYEHVINTSTKQAQSQIISKSLDTVLATDTLNVDISTSIDAYTGEIVSDDRTELKAALAKIDLDTISKRQFDGYEFNSIHVKDDHIEVTYNAAVVNNPTTPAYSKYKDLNTIAVAIAANDSLDKLPAKTDRDYYSQFKSINDVLGGKMGKDVGIVAKINGTDLTPVTSLEQDYLSKMRDLNERYSSRMLLNINSLRAKLKLAPMSKTQLTSAASDEAIAHSIEEYKTGNHEMYSDYMKRLGQELNWSDVAENLMPVGTRSGLNFDISPEFMADSFYRLVLLETADYVRDPNSVEAGHLVSILDDYQYYVGSLFINERVVTKALGGIFGNIDKVSYSTSSTDLFYN